MKTLKQYLKCVGCESEIYECYEYQQMGFDAGLEFVGTFEFLCNR